MTRMNRNARALEWYPTAWRARYGEELMTLLDDSYGTKALPWKVHIQLRTAGIRETLRASGMSGSPDDAPQIVIGSALRVLCAAAMVGVAGGPLLKFNEGWRVGTPSPDRLAPTLAAGLALAAAGLSALVIAAAVMVVFPTLARTIRQRGWKMVAHHVRRLSLFGGVLIGGTAALSVWAHYLPSSARNGSDNAYTAAFFCLLTAAVIMVISTVSSVVALITELELAPKRVRQLGRLGLLMVIALCLVALGAALWWVSLATHATFVIGGPLPVDLVVDLAVMACGLALAFPAARRIHHVLPRLDPRASSS
jgi:hypothetical protein